MVGERFLDEARADLVSAKIQNLFLASSNDQHFFRGDITDVSSVEISIAERRFCLRQLFEIPVNTDRGPNEHRSFAAGLENCPIVIDDPHRYIGRDISHGPRDAG